MKIKCWLAVFLMLCRFVANADIRHDTMRTAKSLIKESKFKKAEKLLSSLHQSHPDDLNTLWLLAQTSYWAKHFKSFNAYYHEAIQKNPTNYYLKLDYALKLLENGDVKKAFPILKTYQSYDSVSNDLKLAFAKITYWQGDFKDALKHLENPSFDQWKYKAAMQQLKDEIILAKSPWIKINSSLVSDDQPMTTFTPSIEAGTYINQMLSPAVSITTPLFLTSSSSSLAKTFSVSNKMNVSNVGVGLNLNAGFMQFPNKTNVLTGNIEITQTSFKHLQLSAQLSRQPYLTTLASVDTTIIPTHYAFSAGWNNLNSWHGKFIASKDQFSDNHNSVSNLSGWFFAPPFNFSNIKLRFGYAYSYSSAKENRYTSKLSLAELITNSYAGNSSVEGIYKPYFTPNQQKVHSALINFSYNPNQEVSIGINASIGFLGSTKNPYLYLDTNLNGDTFLNSGYSTVKFYPDEISAFTLFQLNKKTSLKLNYTFLRNNFYTCHTAGLTLKTSFWHEQKKK